MTIKKRIPKPPGGQLVCSDDQLAIVEVRNGEVFAECHSQPSKIQSVDPSVRPIAILNWSLSRITGERRSENQILTFQDQQILENERFVYIDRKNGYTITVEFKLPVAVKGRGDGGAFQTN
jgi:hypothetical protein